MKLNIERPIAFIDIESTGTNRDEDRIIEISICKLHGDGSREIKTKRINPGIPIPAASREIHGIKDEEVANEPAFRNIANSLIGFLADCDVAGFNSNSFDIPILFAEFNRAGLYWDYSQFKMIDVGNIYKIQEPRTLVAAYKFYCNSEIKEAHSAEADITATVDVFLAQLERYELPESIAELALYCNHGKPVLDLSGKFSMNDKNQIILNFGKYKGEPANDHLDFVDWMYSRANFNPDTNKICKQLLYPENTAISNNTDSSDGLPF